jgi:hypothetical protein
MSINSIRTISRVARRLEASASGKFAMAIRVNNGSRAGRALTCNYALTS